VNAVAIAPAALRDLVSRLEAAARAIKRGHHRAAARSIAGAATDLANLPDFTGEPDTLGIDRADVGATVQTLDATARALQQGDDRGASVAVSKIAADLAALMEPKEERGSFGRYELAWSAPGERTVFPVELPGVPLRRTFPTHDDARAWAALSDAPLSGIEGRPLRVWRIRDAAKKGDRWRILPADWRLSA